MRKTLPLIFLAAMIEGFGDYHLKKYATTKKKEKLFIGVATYGVMIAVLVKIWETDNLAVTNSLWNSCSLIVDGLIGTIILKEKPSKKETLSMLLALGGSSIGAMEHAHL